MWASDGHHRTYRNMGFISPVIVTGGCWHILTHSGVTHLTQRPAIAILTDTLEVEDSIHAMAVLARRLAVFPDAVVDLCARVAATQAVQPLADPCRRLSPRP